MGPVLRSAVCQIITCLFSWHVIGLDDGARHMRLYSRGRSKLGTT
jgi:hypothetical protein